MGFIVLVLLLILVLGFFPIVPNYPNGGHPYQLWEISAPLHKSTANSQWPAARGQEPEALNVAMNFIGQCDQK
jgi:hypothetical protein